MVGNNPVNLVDPFGLQPLQQCPRTVDGPSDANSVLDSLGFAAASAARFEIQYKQWELSMMQRWWNGDLDSQKAFRANHPDIWNFTNQMIAVGSLTTVGGNPLSVAKETQFLYRGVPAGTERYQQALQGIVKPRGTVLDPISLRMHVLGEDVSAGVTSWTTDTAVASRFAGSEGRILKVPYEKVFDNIVPRPFVGGKYGAESEILLKGTINLNGL